MFHPAAAAVCGRALDTPSARSVRSSDRLCWRRASTAGHTSCARRKRPDLWLYSAHSQPDSCDATRWATKKIAHRLAALVAVNTIVSTCYSFSDACSGGYRNLRKSLLFPLLPFLCPSFLFSPPLLRFKSRPL